MNETVLPIATQPEAASIVDTDSSLEASYLVNAVKDPVIGFRQWEGIPTIAADSAGAHLFVGWYSGGKGEGSGNYVTLSVSNNQGYSWLNDRLVVFPKNPLVRFFDPCLWRDKYNKIWLFFSRSRNYWDGDGGVWGVKLQWKRDTILHGKARHLYNGVMINKPIDLQQDNRVLFPVSVWKQQPTDPAKTGTFIYSSYYNGEIPQFQDMQKMASLKVPENIRTFDEHQLVQTADADLLYCFIRTTKGMYYSKSINHGLSWGKLEPFTLVGNTADSRFSITRLRSGNLMLIVNNSTKRSNMVVFLSKNNGVSWPYKLPIDNRENVSYPDVIETNGGVIHLVYDRNRYSSKDILYARFTEKDVLKQNIKGIFRRKVNAQ